MPKPKSYRAVPSCGNCAHQMIKDHVGYFCLEHHFWMLSAFEHICDDYVEDEE